MQREQNKNKKELKVSPNTKIAIVTSEFNDDITLKLEAGAVEALQKAGVLVKNITIKRVPGGFEVPLACDRLAKTKKYKGIVAIACVIRGDTDHYVYIANEATRGIMDVMLKREIPITNAILTVNNLEQAKARSLGAHNKGIEAVKALLAMII